ncbi:hypothetical protein ABVT39_023665 [Epinephelus coioides]
MQSEDEKFILTIFDFEELYNTCTPQYYFHNLFRYQYQYEFRYCSILFGTFPKEKSFWIQTFRTINSRGGTEKIMVRYGRHGLIDVSVIPLMGESDLAQYLPSYGDWVAVVAFCRKRDKDSRKEAIINRIKGRFLGGSQEAAPSTSTGTRGTPWQGNKNGEKKQRRLELGWVDYDSGEQRFKQVRAVKGGGTRSLTIERNTTVDEISVLAESIFFLNGSSIRKKLSDYRTKVRNFAQCQINSSSTCKELYEHTKVRLLRLYLCTKRKDPGQSSNSSTSKLPASQHSASQSPARQCHALEPPSSQTFVLELPTSQCSANEPPTSQHLDVVPPTSQHLDVEPPTSQHFDLEPSTSQCYVLESPYSQHSALESPVYINAGTPEVYVNSFTQCLDHFDISFEFHKMCFTVLTYLSLFYFKHMDNIIFSTELEDDLDESVPLDLQCSSPTTPQQAQDGLREILKDFRGENICEYTTLTVVVRRKRVLQSAINTLGKSYFDWHKHPNTEFVGELAQDSGGPTREFFQIQQCNTEQDWICLGPTLEDWIADCGVPEVYGTHVQDLPQIFGQVVRHFIFHRSAAMIQQFTEGMNSCGRLWDTVKRHWKAFQKVFTQEQGPLTRSAFRALFKVQWSDEETNHRDAEEDTVFSWECLLNTIEGVL